MQRLGSRIVATILAPALVAATPPPRFAIGDIKFAPAADDIIGARRSGMLCTPAGKLRWRDVKPDETALRRALAASFVASGVDVKIPSDDDYDGGITTPYRINLSVLRVSARQCAPWRGIRVGDQARMRVQGRLVTIWRMFDRRTKMLVAKWRICRSFEQTSRSSDPADPLQTALVATSGDFAPALARSSIPSAAERSLGCDAREQNIASDV